MIGRIWQVLASLRTTALLGILIAGYVGLAAIIPQGNRAIELLSLDGTEQLRGLAAYGLTDVFASSWLRALGVLFAGNVLAVLLTTWWEWSSSVRGSTPMPKVAPHQVELAASLPERAVEALRETFRNALGSSPLEEQVEGSKVVMVFETNPAARLAPLLAHLGLVLLVIGAGLASRPPPPARTMVRGQFRVLDSRSGTTGYFDMGQGEPFEFFQWNAKYTLRDYLPSKGRLGPAVRFEEVDSGGKRPPSDFWVYLNAPPGFDQRHRRGSVAIEADWIGMVPAPGSGMASSSAMVLVLAGLGLLIIGAFSGQRAEGRLWIEADGDRVRVLGLPAYRQDPAFQASFARYALLARSAVEG
jgi:hypothetical protein